MESHLDQWHLFSSPGHYFFDQSWLNSSEVSYLALSNTYEVHAPPLLVNQMNEAIIKSITNNSNIQIQVVNAPFPYSQEYKDQHDTESFVRQPFSIYFIIAFVSFFLS